MSAANTRLPYFLFSSSSTIRITRSSPRANACSTDRTTNEIVQPFRLATFALSLRSFFSILIGESITSFVIFYSLSPYIHFVKMAFSAFGVPFNVSERKPQTLLGSANARAGQR